MRFNFLILFIILFLYSPVKSQQVEISAAAYSIISGATQYNQIKDRHFFSNSNPVYKRYSKNWHNLQTLEVLSLINVGIQIEQPNNNIPGIITDVFLVGAIRWIIRDGTYNVLSGNSFFHQSKNTTAQFEMLGTPLLKISFLSAIIIFKYFFLPIL